MTPNINFTRKRWLVLVLYGIINLCVGSLYAWSVFAGPLQEQLGVGSLSMVYTVATSVGPVTMISGGLLLRKLGTRWVLLLSGVVFGMGMFLSGFATGQGFLIITYGLVAGLGAGLAYGCTVGNSVKLFPDKRGLAGGIAAGRIVSGMLSDKIGRINTLTLMLCVSLAGIFLLFMTGIGNYLLFSIGIAAIGVGFGAFLGVFPGFTADRFGQKHQSINYGVMFIGFSIAGLIGPNVASAAYLRSGTYTTAFAVAAALCIAGLVMSLIYRKIPAKL